MGLETAAYLLVAVSAASAYDQHQNASAAAKRQIAAGQKAAQDSANSAIAEAKGLADQQRKNAERQAATDLAAKAASQTLTTADVALDAPTDKSTAAVARKRQQQFGKSYNTGVQI